MDAENISYVRGDTIPVDATLTRGGGWSLSDSTVTMNIKFDDNIVHSVIGTIKNVYKKTVEFPLPTVVTDTVRIGDYDISVYDGEYNVTHLSGIITITQDVS